MNEPKSTIAADMPSEGVRGLINLFLIIHLLMIGLALSAYTSASVLQIRLIETFAPYLRTFNFDLVHTYSTVSRLHLTHAEPSDVDFRVDFQAKQADGTLIEQTLPQPGLWPRIRYQREQTLANVIGGLCQQENEDMQAMLPRAVVLPTIAAASAKSGKIAVTAHYLIDFDDLTGLQTRPTDPFNQSYLQTIYDAQAILGPRQQVSLLKMSKTGEMAPVTPRKAKPTPPLKSPVDKREQ